MKESIDISQKNVIGKCDLKCAYSFKYQESSSVAKNNGVLISLSYDSHSVPPVTFNTQQYSVTNIELVSPSLHLFNGSTMPGEIIIHHSPVKGGNNLAVAIPFVASSEGSTATDMITDIIQKVSTNAPSEGDSTNLNLSGFTLQSIVPRKPFFTYTNDATDWIVFGNIDAIPLKTNTLSTLRQIIQPFPLPMKGDGLYYNSKGPASGVPIGDGIYISCQPTGSSTEETAVEYDKTSSSSVDLSNILNNKQFQTLGIVIISCIAFFVFFYVMYYVFNQLTERTNQVTSIK